MLWDELRDLQKKAVEFVSSRDSSLLLFQQRLGKTWIALGSIERVKPRRTIIVTLLANKETTWETLIRKKLPDLRLVTFSKKTSRNQWKEAIKSFKKEPGILLIHFEALPGVIKQARGIKWDFAVVDELHRGKDRNSLTSRTLAKLRHIPRKLGLTGTPMDSDPADLWAQLRFIAPELLGDKWSDFDKEYMEQPKTDPHKYRPGSIGFRQAIIRRAIEGRECGFRKEKLPKFLSVVKDVCWREELPSPPPEYLYEWVTLTGYQSEVYERFEKKRVVRVGSSRIMGDMPMKQKEKLNQMTGGYVIDDDGVCHELGDAKIRRLRNLISRMGGPAAIFCRYTAEIEAISKILPGRVGVLSGQIKDRRERSRTQERFQGGAIDYIVCQTRTAGAGIDLYKAKYLVIYSTTYSLIDFDQLVARIRLPEQEEPVKIILLLATNTIDEEKCKMIMAKERRVNRTLVKLKKGKYKDVEDLRS